MLRYIPRTETDPYFNLAAEEYLLHFALNDTFMTWRNEASVIIGKHQNTAREVSHNYIQTLNLPVIRRITGGGTVYHDPGNLNFSFIYTQRKGNLVDFREFTLPVILFLRKLGLKAQFEGKSNITASEFKVSGNSAAVHKNKVLYHGTLLFDADLEILEQAVSGNEKPYADKAVRSVRAKVANIKDLMQEKLSIRQFDRLFTDYVLENAEDHFSEELTGEERKAIRLLAENKYRSAKWNYGYSPDYEYFNKWDFEGEEFSVRLAVKNGIITECRISGPQNARIVTAQITKQILQAGHEKNSISENLNKLTFADKRDLVIMNQIRDHLF